ncbi:MAG: glycerol-3-phosphate 1-O-acyltransferase PlsY [Clostridia bacterium]|nr:glycerol-3-phosphate 1-O-acyltransferase PlsY [Clostridia bacterium]
MLSEILQYGLYATRIVPGAEAVPYYIVAILAAVAYLLGSINSAVLLSRLLYREDIREKGSGNAGLTNMLRVYGKKAAILTLVGDFLKTALTVAVAGLFCGFRYLKALSFSPMCWIAALLCVIGHIKPIYYRFRGGKGVLCASVAVLMLSPPVFLVLFAAFVLLVWMTRYVSLGSITAAAFLPLALQGYMQAFIYTGDEEAFYDPGIMLFGVVFAAIIILCHRKNIGRLWRHEESKLSFRKKDKGDTAGGK